MAEVAANNNTYTTLKSDEYIEAAGLERSAKSGRKSSMEKLLEQSLNTSEDSVFVPTSPKRTENLTNGLESPDHQVGVKTSPERPQNLKSEQFIQDAGLSRTGRVARKSSMERLLEDQLQTGETEQTPHGLTNGTTSPTRVLQRAYTVGSPSISSTSSSSDADDKRHRFSSSSSSVDDTKPKSGRKSSIYEQKQIEAPQISVGNQIASRTQHLFQQYEKDMTSHEVKPIANVQSGANDSNSRRRSYECAASTDGKSKVELVREEKAKELEEMKKAYHQRLLQDEQEQTEERVRQRENQDLKYSRQRGSVKDRYMAVAKGEATQQDGNDDDQVDNAPVDKNGMKIERSGGKEEVVKSSDGVGNIRARFGSIGKTSWKKTSQDSDTSTVDIQAVNSARSKFQSLNQKSEDEQQKSVHRPTSRKVKDPKELMEMRKKVTYGDDEEIPEDGVIKKSVVIDESELADCNRKDAINKYEELQKAVENADNTPTNKPKNRLLSDDDAKLELNKRSDSLSGSETGEGDISGDVSGYEGSVSPCSPTSEMSDDYISDTPKDEKVLDGGDETFEPLEAEVTAE